MSFSSDLMAIVVLLGVGLIAQICFTTMQSSPSESRTYGYPADSVWGYVVSRYFWQAIAGPFVLFGFWIYYQFIYPRSDMSALISIISTVYPFSLWAIGKSYEVSEDLATEKWQIRKRFLWQFAMWATAFIVYFVMMNQLNGFYYLLAGSGIFAIIFLYLHIQLNGMLGMTTIKKLEAFCLETITSFIVGTVIVSALPQMQQYIFAIFMLLFAYWKFRQVQE